MTQLQIVRIFKFSLPLWSAGILLFLLLLGNDIRKGYASAAWPTTPGVVTEYRVSSSRGGKNLSSSRQVSYRYEVAQQSYTGKRIGYGFHSASSGSSVGCPVTVYYAPEKPTESLLHPGIHWSNYAIMSALLAALAATPWVWRGLSRHEAFLLQPEPGE